MFADGPEESNPARFLNNLSPDSLRSSVHAKLPGELNLSLSDKVFNACSLAGYAITYRKEEDQAKIYHS
jgi:hypothetical protein